MGIHLKFGRKFMLLFNPNNVSTCRERKEILLNEKVLMSMSKHFPTANSLHASIVSACSSRCDIDSRCRYAYAITLCPSLRERKISINPSFPM